MRYAVILSALLLTAVPAAAQPAAPAKPICVHAQRDTDYNARPIGRHDIFVRNAVGDRRPVRASTTCIHIYPDSFVAVRSSLACLGMGDEVSARTIGGPGERCRISKLTPYVEGSNAAGYK
jgi:hypothetical protein